MINAQAYVDTSVLRNISQPRVFHISMFDVPRPGDQFAVDRVCGMRTRGSWSGNNYEMKWSETTVFLRRPLNYEHMGPCRFKFLNDRDAKGYLTCAERFKTWAWEQPDNGTAGPEAEELAGTLEYVARLQHRLQVQGDSELEKFSWCMKRVKFNKGDNSGEQQEMLSYAYHPEKDVLEGPSFMDLLTGSVKSCPTNRTLPDTAAVEGIESSLETINDAGSMELPISCHEDDGAASTGLEEEEDEEANDGNGITTATVAAARVWDLVEKCYGPQRGKFTDEVESFNLESGERCLHASASQSKQRNDFNKLTAGNYVALFCEHPLQFSVAEVKRIFKWKEGHVPREHLEEVAKGAGHDVFFVVHFFGKKIGSSTYSVERATSGPLHHLIYTRGNELAVKFDKVGDPALDVIAVSHVALACLPNLNRDRSLPAGVFREIVSRIKLHDSQQATVSAKCRSSSTSGVTKNK